MADEELELKLAIEHLELLLEEKEQLEVKIAKQRQRVAAWEILANKDNGSTSLDSILDREGLTDACSTVLRASTKEWMTTSDIQAALREFGFDLGKYKAPHASITTTVNRLADGPYSEVVVRRSSTPGGTEYKWVGSRSRFSEATRKRYGAENSLANQMADGRNQNGSGHSLPAIALPATWAAATARGLQERQLQPGPRAGVEGERVSKT